MNGTALRKKKNEQDSEKDQKKRIICWLIAMPVVQQFKRARWKHTR